MQGLLALARTRVCPNWLCWVLYRLACTCVWPYGLCWVYWHWHVPIVFQLAMLGLLALALPKGRGKPLANCFLVLDPDLRLLHMVLILTLVASAFVPATNAVESYGYMATLLLLCEVSAATLV